MSNNHLIHTNELSQLLIENVANKTLFKQLILNGANINYQNKVGWSVLFECIMLNQIERLEELLSLGVRINQRDNEGRNALFWAIYSKNIEAIKILVANGIDLVVHEDENLIALHYAVYKGSIEIIDLLLESLHVDTKDHFSATPLFYAYYYKRFDVAEHLLRNGADIKSKDKLGNMPSSYVTHEESENLE